MNRRAFLKTCAAAPFLGLVGGARAQPVGEVVGWAQLRVNGVPSGVRVALLRTAPGCLKAAAALSVALKPGDLFSVTWQLDPPPSTNEKCAVEVPVSLVIGH